jgi:sulfate adenylyltransferase subunit 1 (EFTu-like GTPase family)
VSAADDYPWIGVLASGAVNRGMRAVLRPADLSEARNVLVELDEHRQYATTLSPAVVALLEQIEQVRLNILAGPGALDLRGELVSLDPYIRRVEAALLPS